MEQYATHLTCPFCQAHLTVSPSQAGSTTACPHCGGKFQVPLPTAHQGVGPSQPFAGFQNPEIQAFASKKIAAGICGILVGGFGVHKFILGFNTAGAIMLSIWLVGFVTGMCLAIPLLASMAMNVIGLVEGIIYLTKTDEEFFQIYAVERKEWF
jgi:TM2 domain-containing membrane protein YozV